MTTGTLIHMLQSSISPVVLISGFGLLLLTMTNRLGRTIDRVRHLCKELKNESKEERIGTQRQIDILYQRSRLLQTAVGFLSLGIFFVSMTMFLLFSIFIFEGTGLNSLIQLFFTGSLLCLIISLVFFMLDVQLSLQSVKIEIQQSRS